MFKSRERERGKPIINELIVFSTEITKNNVHTFLGVFNKWNMLRFDPIPYTAVQ